MQNAKPAWVRVMLTHTSLVSSYTLYVVELGNDDLISSSIGTLKFIEPVRCMSLIQPIADPLMLIIMRGGGVKDVGDVQPVRRTNPNAGSIVWLYNIELTKEQLKTLSESAEWKQNATTKEARRMGILLRQLATERMRALP